MSPRRALIAVIVVLGLASLLTAATAAALDVPTGGGLGNRTWRPTNQVEARYRLLAGDAVLDLQSVKAPVATIRATVAFGSLDVRVPKAAWVVVKASAGAGRVDLFGRLDRGLGPERELTMAGHPFGRVIHLELRVGAGRIKVHRS